jgi:hypothetical protein
MAMDKRCTHRAKLMSLLPLSLPLSACTSEMGAVGIILLTVLLPAAFVFLLLWGLRRQRQVRARNEGDRRNYPDFDDKDDPRG